MKRLILLCTLIAAAAGCRQPYSQEKDFHRRLLLDFNRTREEVREYIRQYLPEVTDRQLDDWTASGKLEAMELDGRLRYFRNAAPNLFRIDPGCRAVKSAMDGTVNPEKRPMDRSEREIVRNMEEALAAGEGLSAPKRMRVKFTLQVRADAVPPGKTIRCWLPYPRSDVDRQQEVRFLQAGCRTDAGNYFHTETADSDFLRFSEPDCAHSTLYMEAKAVAGFPTTFTEEFEYTSFAETHRDLESRVLPYRKSRPEYLEFTAEREPHLRFTPRLRAIADSLTAGLTHPYLQAKALFRWVNDRFPWASAREYSTIEDIPDYVLRSGHGDCGQVTLLLMAMCRYKGIPAHFQSGFMMKPDAWNMHDWAELYFEGVGWVPVDQSFGIPEYLGLNPPPEKEFFFLGGIDSWRMVVNNDYGRPLSPAKKYPRSETVDFQRGEVEWEGGNLYFDDWDWQMSVTPAE